MTDGCRADTETESGGRRATSTPSAVCLLLSCVSCYRVVVSVVPVCCPHGAYGSPEPLCVCGRPCAWVVSSRLIGHLGAAVGRFVRFLGCRYQSQRRSLADVMRSAGDSGKKGKAECTQRCRARRSVVAVQRQRQQRQSNPNLLTESWPPFSLARRLTIAPRRSQLHHPQRRNIDLLNITCMRQFDRLSLRMHRCELRIRARVE